MWIQTCIGMHQSFSATYSCPYCLVHKDFLHDTNKSELRTLEMAYRCTHTAKLPFTCDGCEVTFNSPSEIAKTQPINEQTAKAYRRKHFGWNFETPPCLDIEPRDLFVCSLHLKLSIGKKLFSYAVTECITDKQTNLPALVSTLKNIGITALPEMTRASDAKMSVNAVRLNGSEVDAFFKHVDKILDVLDAVESHRNHVTTAVDLFYDVYEALTDPNPTTAIARAEVVRSRATAFFEHILSWIGDGGVNYYMHHLIHHIPDQILRLPDNFPFQHASGIALEAQNRLAKRALRQHCNYNRETATSQVLQRLTSFNRVKSPDQRRSVSIERSKRNLSRTQNKKTSRPARRARQDE